MPNPTVAVFDFDGTITTRDTLPLFVNFVKGRGAFAVALLRRLPALMLCSVERLCGKNNRLAGVKESILASCFAGVACSDMEAVAHNFAATIDTCLNPHVMRALRSHQAEGHQVVIASASPAVWIEPWASRNGISTIIATRMAVTCDGRYTGAFYGANCNGEEKLHRVQALFPRERYHLVAYGNSRGDYPLLRYAREAYICTPRAVKPFDL